MNVSELTPLMKQYHEIKQRHPDIIVFFRLGDFYEMFGEDAQHASKLLNITLTARQGVPMCGVPHHSVQQYIERLLKQGCKIAVCEQLEEPGKGKKLVKRDVVRIITPGTVVEETFLDDKSNNYLVCVVPNKEGNAMALAAIDVSTGAFRGTRIQGVALWSTLFAELGKYTPREMIMPEHAVRDKHIASFAKDHGIAISVITRQAIEEYKDDAIARTIPDNMDKLLYYAALGIVGYVHTNYKEVLTHLAAMEVYDTHTFMMLNEHTIRHLELIENAYTRERRHSVLDVLDCTATPMGARLLRQWLLEPLLDEHAIRQRQTMVQLFVNDNDVRMRIREELAIVKDFERMISRINCNANIPRDLVFLKQVLCRVPTIKALLVEDADTDLLHEHTQSPLLAHILEGLRDMRDLAAYIESTIVENPPNNLKDGGVIKEGCNAELDELRKIKREGSSWLAEYERAEKERTGIATLRVRFNNVFGYYIEITKAQARVAPQDYVRTQTLANAERFTTEALKQFEVKILKAENEMVALETQVYNAVREKIKEQIQQLNALVHSLTLLDVFTNFAECAVRNNYTCPVIDNGYDLVITEGRHPVVEVIASDQAFVPNDTQFSDEQCHLYLVTGPNMAGKSTYIRQVALITIMAQMGSFVPAQHAHIGIVDKLFTRIGSGDKLVKGESTFMVEMKETAEIIRGATSKSLVILDEVGRGTSTFDGISLAWVIVEELVSRTWYNNVSAIKGHGPRTLFATHYFELVELASHLPYIKNCSMAVREWNDDVVFLHKVIDGASDRSYGIHVAKIAGVPLSLIERARLKLHELETKARDISDEKEETDATLFDANDAALHPILSEIKTLPVDTLSPLGALLKIKEWQEQLK